MIERGAGLRLVAAMAAAAVAGGIADMSAGAEAVPECHVHQSKEVSFRERDSKDVLEMSIGTGPCFAATLTIVVRTEFGEILYSYVEMWKRHTAVNWQDPDLPDVAQRFIEAEMADSLRTTASLPPYAEANEFYDAYHEVTQVSREDYERFRGEDRPLFCHSTHYEAWRCVLFDRRPYTSAIVVVGGL